MATSRNPLKTRELWKNVRFQFYAPEAREVQVAGSFNEWNTRAFRLRRGSDGNWAGEVKLEPGRYEYRFVIDGRWENDQKAQESVPNPFGSWNSVIEVR